MHAEHPLEDCYLKVARAKEQIISVREEVLEFSRDNPLEITGSENIKTGERVFRIPKVPRWPQKWEVIVGEIGHNLRSALDYIVFQVASDAEKNRTAFPISESEREYFKPRGKRRVSYRDACLRGVDPKWAAWIDKLQPFNDPFPVSGANALVLLNLLSNRDKHRTRIPCYTLIELPSVIVTLDSPVFVQEIEVWEHADGRVSTKYVGSVNKVVKGGRLLEGLDPKNPPDSKTGLDIAFSRRRILLPQLAILATYIEFIVDSFDPAFGPATRPD